VPVNDESVGSLPRLCTLQETAYALRLSKHTIRSFVRQGKLHPVTICRRLLFLPADVEKLILANSGTEQRQRPFSADLRLDQTAENCDVFPPYSATR
jgi:Helix-turn-helix domain